MSVRVYVEGAGASKEARSRCREGFRKLIAAAGLIGRMPRVIACGPRADAFADFCVALNSAPGYALLLVDSESPVAMANPTSPDAPEAWAHLTARERWRRPPGAANDQAQLMVTCMEAWISGDRQALKSAFGSCLREQALPSLTELERRSPEEHLTALEQATQGCKHRYRKGDYSFRLLGTLSSATVKASVTSFTRFVTTLARHCSAG